MTRASQYGGCEDETRGRNGLRDPQREVDHEVQGFSVGAGAGSARLRSPPVRSKAAAKHCASTIPKANSSPRSAQPARKVEIADSRGDKVGDYYYYTVDAKTIRFEIRNDRITEIFEMR